MEQAGVSLEETLGHTGNVAIALDGMTHEEYFYIELPLSGSTTGGKRRFVHVKPAGGGGDRQDRFPMHFGMEVSRVVNVLCLLIDTILDANAVVC